VGSAHGRREWTAQAGGASGRRDRMARSDGVQMGRYWDAIGAISAPGPLGWAFRLPWVGVRLPWVGVRLPWVGVRLPWVGVSLFYPRRGALRTRIKQGGSSRRAAPSGASGPAPPRAARGAAPRARAHRTPRAHRGGRAPPPVELPLPGSEAGETHLRNNRHVRYLRGAPCVRCVHARRGVRSGEAATSACCARVRLCRSTCAQERGRRTRHRDPPPTSPPACVRADVPA